MPNKIPRFMQRWQFLFISTLCEASTHPPKINCLIMHKARAYFKIQGVKSIVLEIKDHVHLASEILIHPETFYCTIFIYFVEFQFFLPKICIFNLLFVESDGKSTTVLWWTMSHKGQDRNSLHPRDLNK